MNDDLDAMLGVGPAPQPKSAPKAPRPPKVKLTPGVGPQKKAKPAPVVEVPKRKPGRPRKPVVDAPRKSGRPTKAEAAAWAAKKAADHQASEPDESVARLAPSALPDETAFHRPVTRTFLATVLGVEPRRLVKRLAACKPVGYMRPPYNDTPLYDFKDAISYCVDPKIDIGDWLKTQNAMSLPPAISKSFWDAMRSKQMVEERARDLWRTADVLEVLGRTALSIKNTSQMWLENLPGKATLTSEQYDMLRREVASLLDEIHQALVTDAAGNRTQASIAEIDAMLSEHIPSDEEPL